MTVTAMRQRLQDLERNGHGDREVCISVPRGKRTTLYYLTRYIMGDPIGLPTRERLAEIKAAPYGRMGREWVTEYKG